MRTPPFSHKVHNSTGDTPDKRPRQSNDSPTYRTRGSLDSNHNRPIILHRYPLLSKFPPIFGKTASKDASHLNVQFLLPPTKTDKPAPESSPTTSCFTIDSDPFRRPSPVQPVPPDEQLMLSTSLSPPPPPPPPYDRAIPCELLPGMQGIIHGTTRISPTNPVRAFHMPTRWAPRTTQMDRDPSSHPSQENPLKLVLESDSLITPHWKSTSLLPTIPQIHLDTYDITTPPCSPEGISLEAGSCFVSDPSCSELNCITTHDNSFDGISEDETWKHVLYPRKHSDLKDRGRREVWLLVRAS